MQKKKDSQHEYIVNDRNWSITQSRWTHKVCIFYLKWATADSEF